MLSGSSPLARGLLAPHRQLPQPARIIPARAGFTCDVPRGVQAIQDHPRSRGVYWVLRGMLCATRGSSPLARGLLPGDKIIVRVRRIIPARAGFTLARPGRVRVTRDHPRSRGVYKHTETRLNSADGSSPLARGLLLDFSFMGRQYGIIPARAGFTC